MFKLHYKSNKDSDYKANDFNEFNTDVWMVIWNFNKIFFYFINEIEGGKILFNNIYLALFFANIYVDIIEHYKN